MKSLSGIQSRFLNQVILLVLLALPLSIQALDTVNQSLLDHVKKYPRSSDIKLPNLVPKLISIAASASEKAEVLFYWISQNIVYDIAGLQSGNYIMTVAETIKQGKGICHNYAQLYQAMCQAAGLECHYIGGYAKGYGYAADEPLKEINHAWNAVKIEGEYLFVDATFGSGYVKSEEGQIKYYSEIRIKEVLEKVGRFSTTHLPASPVWQLLEYPISVQRFQAYDSFEEMKINDGTPVDYQSDLDYYLSFSADWQKVLFAKETYRFNPTEENNWWLGVAYWAYADKLAGRRYSSRRLNKSLSAYQSAIDCFNTVDTRQEEAQEEILKIRHNMKQVRRRLAQKR